MWYQFLTKGAGMILLSAGCCMAGRQMEAGLKKRKLFFRDAVSLLPYLEKEMLHRRTAMNEALYAAALLYKDPWKQILGELSEQVLRYTGNTFSELWQMVLGKYLEKDFLKEEEWEAVYRIASCLGGSDAALQQTMISSSLEQMKELERKAADEYEMKGRLYRRLSVFAAVFLILILL